MSNNKNKFVLKIKTKLGLIIFWLFLLLSTYISTYQMFYKGAIKVLSSLVNNNILNFIIGLIQSVAAIPVFFGIVWVGLILGMLCDYLIMGDI